MLLLFKASSCLIRFLDKTINRVIYFKDLQNIPVIKQVYLEKNHYALTKEVDDYKTHTS